MLRSRWVRLLVIVVAAAAVLWVATRPRPRPLLHPVQVPRPAPVPEPGTPPFSFAHADDPFREHGDDLRLVHNRMVRDLEAAVEAYERGDGSLRRAEQIEMRIAVARHQLGVTSETELHEALARLFEREARRLEQGPASDEAVAEAWLYVARERYLAGRADTGYAEKREAVIRHYEERVEHLQELESRELTVLQDELAELRAEFPPPRPGSVPPPTHPPR